MPGGGLAAGVEGHVHGVLERLAHKNEAREAGLAASRQIIRLSANCIRAIHRGDVVTAMALLAEAAAIHRGVVEALEPHPDIFHAGFLHDAQKEYAEAASTLAILSGKPIPAPPTLGVGDAAFLNGIAETVGEIRRAVLDRLRSGKIDECDPLLQAMDDIYSLLITVDYPDALTGGLRRSTDQARGILEKTRGDLALATVVDRATGRVARPGNKKPFG